ncbi:M6 family metalloprotease domain-containing protein [Acanthopleuribacter pedis]|uniref:M6 family metalloprotease domain-containing protein n=1 Tax=Acanthopleuribacter pedis TaxID=442870 RepID=A0A8J7U5H1_9BACT|nr:M6 family metalloprotease domain-containing protein [Acanthopleuribacter pedis]MBO1321722.1 M6 family metalloprotease domain-containing protein [Acanthopleuribacter pedis]
MLMRFPLWNTVFFAAIFLLSLPAFAGLANPRTTVLVGEPGQEFEVRIVGDEWANYVEKDGYTLVRNPANDHRWEYAVRNRAGQLVPSGFEASLDSQAPEGLAKNVRPVQSYEDLRAQHFPTAYSRGLDHGYARDKNAVNKYEPQQVSGPRNLLFIRVNFSDRALTTTADAWDSMIFDETAGAKTVANYYKDNSFGLIQMQGVPHTNNGEANGILTVSINVEHPNTGRANLSTSEKYAKETAWINAALAEASGHVDFAALDTSGDGSLTLDEAVIYFIVAGYDAASSANEPNVWGHKWSAWRAGDVMAGSVQLPSWALNGELADDGSQHTMGVITHELGHLMCGLPDLYDINSQNAAMGIFSLMASGSWGSEPGEAGGTTPTNMDAWSRYILGWSLPRQPVSGTNTFEAALTDRNTPVLFETNRSYEYFLAENRAPVGWDRGMIPRLSATLSTLTEGSTTIESQAMTYSPTGTVTAVVRDSGLGRVGDFPAASNYIALIERGEISFSDKVKNAKAAGAIGAIVYQSATAEGIVGGTLGAASDTDFVPATGVSRADGQTLNGKTLTLTINGGTWDGGVLIQHVDTTMGTEGRNDINSSANTRQGVTVVEASQIAGSLLTNGGSGGHATHLFSAATASAWTDSTDPSARYYDGSSTGFALYDFSAAGTTMTASTTPSNQAPTAAFSSQVSDLSVSFTNNASDSDGSIASYAWTFGDGNSATSANPSHTYASAGTYTVTLTVTDNDGASDSASASVTVTEPSGGGSGGGASNGELTNGTPVNNLSGAEGEQSVFFIDVPAGASNLSFVTHGGSGDADLYYRYGSEPTTGNYGGRSWASGNGESLSVASPQTGRYYVLINAYRAYAGMTLTVSYDAPSGGGDSGGGDSGSGSATSGSVSPTLAGRASNNYTIDVAGGTIDLSASWSGSGDIDIFLLDPNGNQVASAETSANPENLSYNTNGVTGTYTIRVYNYRSSSKTFTLQVNWMQP